MYEIDCPHCDTKQFIEAEDLPRTCCDSETHECCECGKEFDFGYYIELEVR